MSCMETHMIILNTSSFMRLNQTRIDGSHRAIMRIVPQTMADYNLKAHG